MKSHKEEIFIDENVNILTGEKARSALAKKNDLEFFSAEKGIVKVPEVRWKMAQQAEKIHWMVNGRKVISDRNENHWLEFDRYQNLAGRTFKRAVEIGCGPFTNMRFIGRVCRIEELELLDPLIDSYLDHPFCRYSNGSLILDNPEQTVVTREIPERVAW